MDGLSKGIRRLRLDRFFFFFFLPLSFLGEGERGDRGVIKGFVFSRQFVVDARQLYLGS